LRGGLQKAVKVADLDPELALTRPLKVLDYIIRDVYQRTDTGEGCAGGVSFHRIGTIVVRQI
jgi:hypothetical protein